MSKKYVLITSSLLAFSLLAMSPAYAAENVIKSAFSKGYKQEFEHSKKLANGPGIMGTVSSINGDSITLVGKNGTTYMVLAKDAKVMKVGTTAQIGAISKGDNLLILGTANGSTITAKKIFDGAVQKMNRHGKAQIKRLSKKN